MPSTKKQGQLTELLNELKETPNFALIKFDRTTHTSLEGLRKELKKNSAKLKVIKNSLFEKALHKLSSDVPAASTFDSVVGSVKENTGIVRFPADWSSAVKSFFTYAKKDTTLTFKGGLLDGTAYKAEDMNKIAELPAKDQLIAKVIGGMKSPMYSMVYNMKFNMQKMVYVLSEAAKKSS